MVQLFVRLPGVSRSVLLFPGTTTQELHGRKVDFIHLLGKIGTIIFGFLCVFQDSQLFAITIPR